jgi:hypothetical protein
MPAAVFVHDVRRLPTALLKEAPWNANKASRATLEKLRNSLAQYGVVENSVVRPDWTLGCKTDAEVETRRQLILAEPTFFETLSGNHRLLIYREAGLSHVPTVVVEVSDPRAQVLAQVLNRTRGKDQPDKLKALLLGTLNMMAAPEMARFLPQSERDLLKLIQKEDDKDNLAPDPKEGGGHDSKVGQVYQLGPHRLLCGSSTDTGLVAALFDGAKPRLMATDPPYNVELDQSWRDGAGVERLAGSGSEEVVAGDAGFDWVDALRIPECAVAYVWHADKFSGYTQTLLERFGYRMRKQIIWVKSAHVLSRTPYHYQHEPCWYAVKAGTAEPWYGGANQTTTWHAASPKNPMAGGNAAAGEEGKTTHPTQKPIVLFETPIVNHLLPGEHVYDPFGGSGSCLIAAARTNRRCLTAELMPKWCDVIRLRWTKWAADRGVDPGPGALSA